MPRRRDRPSVARDLLAAANVPWRRTRPIFDDQSLHSTLGAGWRSGAGTARDRTRPETRGLVPARGDHADTASWRPDCPTEVSRRPRTRRREIANWGGVVSALQSRGTTFEVSEGSPPEFWSPRRTSGLGPYGVGSWTSGKVRKGPIEHNWINRRGSQDFSDGGLPGHIPACARTLDVAGASNFVCSLWRTRRAPDQRLERNVRRPEVGDGPHRREGEGLSI